MKRLEVPNNFLEVKDLQDIQRILLFMMKKFHDFCIANNLIYNVFGGTMLGAVRHNNIIPWDDDIDVTMPFSDYERLTKLIINDKDFILKQPGDKGYPYPYAKLCLKKTILIEKMDYKYSISGAFIDIFPVGEYPSKNENRFFKRLQSFKVKRVRTVSKISSPCGLGGVLLFPLKALILLFYKAHDASKIAKKEFLFLRNHQTTPNNQYLLLYGAGWGQKGKLKKSIYFDRKLYRFADFWVYGIRDYNDHLQSLYGDFWVLPPENNRVAVHDYKLYIENDLFNELNNGKTEK